MCEVARVRCAGAPVFFSFCLTCLYVCCCRRVCACLSARLLSCVRPRPAHVGGDVQLRAVPDGRGGVRQRRSQKPAHVALPAVRPRHGAVVEGRRGIRGAGPLIQHGPVVRRRPFRPPAAAHPRRARRHVQRDAHHLRPGAERQQGNCCQGGLSPAQHQSRGERDWLVQTAERQRSVPGGKGLIPWRVPSANIFFCTFLFCFLCFFFFFVQTTTGMW